LQAVRARLEKKTAQEQERQQGIEQIQRALLQAHNQRLSQSKIAAMFSHDLRNGLTAILVVSGLLRRHGERIDEQRRQLYLSRIEASANHLVQMLDDMLVVAQMDTGSFTCRPAPVYMVAFLQEIIDEFRVLDREAHQITLEHHCQEVVMADPRLLRQIASNLLSNAGKYSPAGSQIRITLDEDEDARLCLTVEDQGIGIPADEQTQLFEAFQRGSNVGGVKGTGLGLAIVKQAVDLHGGWIRLESRPGSGATFVVTLPC
jgi:signal transduction histidine kinase